MRPPVLSYVPPSETPSPAYDSADPASLTSYEPSPNPYTSVSAPPQTTAYKHVSLPFPYPLQNYPPPSFF
jgi:hypothetical protein